MVCYPTVGDTAVPVLDSTPPNAHPGVNSNLLNPAELIDVPSGTQVVNGVPCTVRSASVHRNHEGRQATWA